MNNWASDVARKRRAQTIYANQLIRQVAIQNNVSVNLTTQTTLVPQYLPYLIQGEYEISPKEKALILSVKPPTSETTITVPGAPTNVVGTAGNTSVTLNWVAPVNNGGSIITGYTVTSSPGGFTATSATTTATVSGLTNGTPYTFTVVATNVAGNSVASTPSSAVTPLTVPGAPTNVVGTAGDRTVTLNWVAPVNNGGSTILRYTATSSPGGFTATSLYVPTVAVHGLTNGTTYTFTVVAINVAGSGPASAPSSAITVGNPPGAPTNVVATAGNTSASVTWVAPVNNGGSAITGYTVTSSPGGFTATSATTTATVSGLTNGTPYTFTVVATNAIGNSVASTPSSAVTPLTVPGAPTNVVATAGNTSASVTWVAPVNNGGSAITGYTVTSSPGGFTATSATTTATVSGLTNGTPYTFTVVATNLAGNSVASTPSSAVTPPGAVAPGAPTNLIAQGGNQTAIVFASAPASNGGSPILSYTFTSSPDGFTVTSPNPTAQFTGLTNGTAYTFTAVATNIAGNSVASSASSAVTPSAVQKYEVFAAAGTPLSKLYASTDGVSFTVVGSVNDKYSCISFSVYNGSYYIIGLYQTPQKHMYISYDGYTLIPQNTNVFLIAVYAAWNGSYWIAMGYDDSSGHSMAISYNGLDWSYIENDPFINSLGAGAYMGMSIGWNGSYWLAAAGDSTGLHALATSADGLNWSYVQNDPFTNSTYSGFKVAWNGSYWLVSGSDSTGISRLYKSSDAVNWTLASTGTFSIYSQVWNGVYWLYIDTDEYNTGYVRKSTDGLTWTTTSTLNINLCYLSNLSWNPSLNLWFIEFTGILADPGGARYSSPDGVTWTSITLPGSTNAAGSLYTPYPPIVNGSMYFTSASTPYSYLSIPSTNLQLTSASFTIEWWQNISNNTHNARVFSIGAIDTSPSIAVSYENFSGGNTGTFYLWFNGSANTVSTGFTIGSWQHIALVGTGGNTIKVYVNGTQLGSTITTTYTFTNAYPLILGNVSAAATIDQYIGYISNFRWVEGTAVYSSTFTPPTSPLTPIAGTQLLLLAQSPYKIIDSTHNTNPVRVSNVSWSPLKPFAS